MNLGGKSPNIVFDDADVDAAVDGSLFGIFYNTGQSCEARSRLYVHEDIYDEFMEKFVEKRKSLNLGIHLIKELILERSSIKVSLIQLMAMCSQQKKKGQLF